jgi:hypothetical protein
MTVDNDTDKMKSDDKIGPGELKKNQQPINSIFFYTYSKKKNKKKINVEVISLSVPQRENGVCYVLM